MSDHNETRDNMSDDFWGDLAVEMERLNPSSLAAHIDPTRPYDGQPHTDTGERGATEVKGITFRDLRDCYFRACYESSGLPIEQWPGDIYALPWQDMDPIAIAQNLSNCVEKVMGIYPNVPAPACPDDPNELHWCGPTLEGSTWRDHQGNEPQPRRMADTLADTATPPE